MKKKYWNNLFIYFVKFLLVQTLNTTDRCFEAATSSKGSCLQCAEDYYSPKQSPFLQDPFPIQDCTPKLDSTLEIDIYVTEFECPKSVICDGSIDHPLDSLVSTLDILNNKSRIYFQTKARIYLLGEEIFMLEDELEAGLKYYFRGTLISLSISPFFCSLRRIHGCREDAEIITISLKTNKILFFISGLLNITHIAMNGVDMPLEINSTNSSCYFEKKNCCNYGNIEDSFFSDCYIDPFKPNIISTKFQTYGLINTEMFLSRKNASIFFVPKIIIENCELKNIFTLHPTDSPRFLTFVHVLSPLIDLTIRNLIINECFFEEGIIRQSTMESFFFEEKVLQYINIFNVSVIKYKSIYEQGSAHAIISIDYSKSMINISVLSLSKSRNSKVSLLKFNVSSYADNSIINIENVYLGEIEGINFLYCSFCNKLLIQNLIIFRLKKTSSNTEHVLDINYVGEFTLSYVFVKEFYFIKNEIEDFFTFSIKNIYRFLELNNTYFETIYSLMINIESSIIKWQSLVATDIITDTNLLKISNCSLILDKVLLAFIAVFTDTVIDFNRLNSLQITGGHFLSFKFFLQIIYSSIIGFSVTTKTEEILMQNITINNCTHKINDGTPIASLYLIASNLNKIDLKNIDFSFHPKGLYGLIDITDVCNINLTNLYFKENKLIDYYLIFVSCLECNIYISNVIIENASFLSGCFSVEGSNKTILENFTFTDISAILPSNYGKYCFYFGIIEIYENEICELKNWFFLSSLNFNFTPSRFLFMQGNTYLILQNFTLYIFENQSDPPPEVHILLAAINENLIIERLYAKNFFCQTTYPRSMNYEGGVMSFINSESFMQENSLIGTINLTNISIENCKNCMNGVLGLINTNIITMNSIYISSSENLRGGALAVYYSRLILLVDFHSQNCSALQYGGALYFSNCFLVLIRFCFLFQNQAPSGGSLFLKGIKNFKINNMVFINSKATYGAVLWAIEAEVIMNGGLAMNCIAVKEGGCFYLKKGTIQMAGGFEGVQIIADSGGFAYALEVREAYLENITLKKTSGQNKGMAFLFEDCLSVIAEGITMVLVNSDTGIGNIYIENKYNSANYKFRNVVCDKVKILSSVFFHVDTKLVTEKTLFITIADILISEGFGSVGYLKGSIFTKNHLISLVNITVTNVTTYLNKINKTTEWDYLFLFDSTYAIISNLILKSINFYILVFSVTSTELITDNIYFISEPSNIQGARYLFHISDSRIILSKIQFLGKPFTNAGLILSEMSNFTLIEGFLWKCNAYTSTCLDIYYSLFDIRSFTFLDCIGHDNGILNSIGSSFFMERNIFKVNPLGNFENLNKIKSRIKSLNIFGKYNNKASAISECIFLENNSNRTILLLNSSNIYISYSLFVAQENISSQIKAIRCISSDIKINKTSFINFFDSNGGTLRIEHPAKAEIKNFILLFSEITNSRSDYGGAFTVFGLLNIYISDNLFLKNEAIKIYSEQLGNFGVGLFICNLCEKTVMFFLNNILVNNYAENAIATVFSNFYLRTVSSTENNNFYSDSNIYVNNSDGVNFTGNISFLPFRMNLFPRSTETMKFDYFAINFNEYIEFRSGQALNISVVMLDNLGQQFIFDQASKLKISESDKGKLSLFIMNKRKYLSKRGEFKIDSFLVNAEPNKSFELLFQIDINIDYLSPEDKKFVMLEPLRRKFFSKPCEIGEIIIESDFSCLKCPPGKYSIIDPMKQNSSIYNQKCLNCPTNAFCPGGSIITPKDGFWRYSNTSTLIVECLSKISCLGRDNGLLNDEELIHGKCLKHSFGPMCYMCEPGYARFSKKGVCRICDDDFESSLKLGLIIVVLVIYSLIQIKLALQLTNSSIVGILLKIIVTHFQQLSLISLVDLGWTLDFKAFFSLQAAFSFLTDDILPLECLFLKIGYNIYIQKVIATTFYPILLSMLLLLLWIIFSFIIDKKNNLSRPRRLYKITHVIFFIVIILLFPEIISKCLSLLTCLPIDNSSSIKLLLYSPDLVCWSDEHKTFLMYAAIPGIITWGLLAPLIIFYFLIINKKDIQQLIEEGKNINQNTKMIDRYERLIMLKFLFKGYRSKYFFWEVCILFKKLLLISIGCITDMFPSKLRGVILLVFIAIFLLIHMRCRPYESSTLNRLQFFSLMTTFLTANIGIMMFSYDFNRISTILLIFVILIHMAFLLYWIFLFIEDIALRKRILKLIEYLFKNKFKNNLVYPESLTIKRSFHFVNKTK